MKVETTEDVHDLMAGYIDSTALGTALELGLFWRLREQPKSAANVGKELGIPSSRCRHWLELLVTMDLLNRQDRMYSPSAAAYAAILDVYGQDTWAHLAQEWRERFPAVHDLALHISDPGSVWAAQGLEPPRYFAQLNASPQRARRFTRMLYELHQPLAQELAETLDLTGVQRLMDLGGGSGVMSLALLRRHAHLVSVVVDIGNVCSVGREIAAEHPEADRITYFAADFLHEALPGDFDMVLECDVGHYDTELFHKLWSALNTDGRLVIVDQFAPAEARAPAARPYLHWAFLGSLQDPKSRFQTAAVVKTQLTESGFHLVSENTLSNAWLMIEAEK